MKALIINCSPVRNGATARIAEIIGDELKSRYEIKNICIDDYSFAFCKGCRSCHKTAECVQHDDVDVLMGEFEHADVIVSVSPSYWADIPGQFKAFIDRCTPWCRNANGSSAASSIFTAIWRSPVPGAWACALLNTGKPPQPGRMRSKRFAIRYDGSLITSCQTSPGVPWTGASSPAFLPYRRLRAFPGTPSVPSGKCPYWPAGVPCSS